MRKINWKWEICTIPNLLSLFRLTLIPVYLVQSMLTVLHDLVSTIPTPSHSGILDPRTVESLAAFQTYAGLPPTGELDKRTWKDLALHFALAADWLVNRDGL